ncbi:MAG: hypothetical protein ABFD62_02160 [Syntrophaceae bacterium]
MGHPNSKPGQEGTAGAGQPKDLYRIWCPKVWQAAEPLLFDTPYRVLLIVYSEPGGLYYDRKYLSNFCVTRNEKGETVLVAASGDGKGEWRCLKPGEKPRRGFWERLFGR